MAPHSSKKKRRTREKTSGKKKKRQHGKTRTATKKQNELNENNENRIRSSCHAIAHMSLKAAMTMIERFDLVGVCGVSIQEEEAV